MADRAAFLAAIRANPDDDGVRLVYADWLQERGEAERAEFVRVQCELARRAAVVPTGAESGTSFCRGVDLRRQERQLLATHGHDWFPGPSRFGRIMVPTGPVNVGDLYGQREEWGWHTSGTNDLILATPSRGFVESVTCTAADWISHGDAILAEHPVTEVRLTNLPDESAVELSNPLNTEPHPRMRWRGGRAWIDVPAGFPTGQRAWVKSLLSAEWPAVRTWHLPPEPWTGEVERAELETIPDFADVTQWNPIENLAGRDIVHPVWESQPRVLSHDRVTVHRPSFGHCRVQLDLFEFPRNGTRYRFRAGRCQHGAFYTRAEPLRR